MGTILMTVRILPDGTLVPLKKKKRRKKRKN